MILSTIALAAAEGAKEESSGSYLVSPSGGLMIWTLVVFGVAMALLYKLAFPAIAEALDKRQKLIEDSIDSANKTKAEASELLEEYRERLKEARVQAEDIVTRARKAGEETEREAREAARTEREDILKQAERDREAAFAKASQDIRKEVADLTVLATEKVTRKTLTADDQQRLVEEALGELDFSALGGGSQN